MRIRLLLSLLAFAAGSSILIISLFSATQVFSTGSSTASESKLYFSQEILPDHSLYKAVMAMDRLQLETTPPEEQIFVRIEYAHRRLDYAKSLLEKQNEELAMTTLLKSQQYLHQAAQQTLQKDTPTSIKERVAKAIEYHTTVLKEISPQFTDAHRAHIDQLIQEHHILVVALTTDSP
jgi:hypothetical protein